MLAAVIIIIALCIASVILARKCFNLSVALFAYATHQERNGLRDMTEEEMQRYAKDYANMIVKKYLRK